MYLLLVSKNHTLYLSHLFSLYYTFLSYKAYHSQLSSFFSLSSSSILSFEQSLNSPSSLIQSFRFYFLWNEVDSTHKEIQSLMNKITRQIQTFLMKKNDLSIQQVLLLLMKCLMYYKECYVYLIKQQYKENQTRIHHVFHQMNELMNRITHSIIDFSTVSSLLIDFWFFLSHSSVVFFHSLYHCYSSSLVSKRRRS